MRRKMFQHQRTQFSLGRAGFIRYIHEGEPAIAAMITQDVRVCSQNARMPYGLGLDPIEFDALTTNFDLSVNSAQKLKVPVRMLSHEIA